MSLSIEDLVVGDGAEAAPDRRVTIRFTTDRDDGARIAEDAELTFVLDMGEVVDGLDRGVTGMRAGGVRRLVVPPALAYGERGAPDVPPGATLRFEVHLVAVE